MIGQTLGHYQIEERLGEGGMGVVYRARDLQLGRPVALKVLGEQMAGDSTGRARLLREARTASALNHPHICTIHEVGESAGQSYVVMEYVEGHALKALIPKEGLPIEKVLLYGAQIADALAHAHARGVVHRDLKTANVVITPEERAKVLDFGLAKQVRKPGIDEATRSQASLTQAGAIVGTLHYMPPEVLQGKQADAKSDVWSLGVLLYEMAAGKLPFEGRTAFELSSAILREPPAALPPRLPANLRAVILRCLAKEPSERYQPASDVHAALEAAQSQAASLAVARRPRAFARRTAFGVASGVLAVLLAVAAVLNSNKIRQWLRPGSVSAKIQSLAVLPLKNLSRDPEQEFFADGMTEALLTDLAQIGALKVISHTSVIRYKNTQKTLPEIGRELNVDAVVEGSVQRPGDRVRVTAQLIEARTDRHLWANTYERDLRDVLALQDEVARAIAEEIKVTLTPEEHGRLANAHPVKPEAYEAYLRGIYHLSKPGDEDHDAGLRSLERATALDPQFALAQAALAGAYIGRYFSRDAKKEWEEKAFVSIQKALSLDPNLAEAYLARGNLAWTLANHFPHERAIKDVRHALALKPNLVGAHFALGAVYLHIGLLEKSLEELNAALALDPHNFDTAYRIPRVHLYQQKYELALSEFDRLAEAPPTWKWQSGLALLYLGRTKEALALIETAIAASPPSEDLASTYAVLLAASGRKQKAEEQIRLAIKVGAGRSHFHHAEYNIASSYALMGNNRLALEWLQKSADDGFPCYPLFEKDPNVNGLRSDPGFLGFMSKIKAQWERYRASL